jgi:hypothetical protein
MPAKNSRGRMKQVHMITLEPSRLGVGERVVLDAITAMLWPLKVDHRMTVLLNLLAVQIDQLVETDDQIDAIIDTLRMTLKLSRHGSPPLQNY